MTWYFRHNNSPKTADQWAARMYKTVWDCTFTLWEHRNTQLHETKRIADMEGIEQLKQSITKEYAMGIGRLPACDFSHMFRTKLEDLLTKSDEVLQNWFLVIRQGRLLMDSDHLIEDEFQTNKALQKWIGLSDNITDAEGVEPMKEAILRELNIGRQGLPFNYERYFKLSGNEILNQSITQMRLWLGKVRQGRIRYDQNNIIQDEFTHAGAFRDWLGF